MKNSHYKLLFLFNQRSNKSIKSSHSCKTNSYLTQRSKRSTAFSNVILAAFMGSLRSANLMTEKWVKFKNKMTVCPGEVNRQGHIAVGGKCTVAGHQIQTKSFVFNRRRGTSCNRSYSQHNTKNMTAQRASGTHSFT